MVRTGGLEPSALGLGNPCSVPLSYVRVWQTARESNSPLWFWRPACYRCTSGLSAHPPLAVWLFAWRVGAIHVFSGPMEGASIFNSQSTRVSHPRGRNGKRGDEKPRKKVKAVKVCPRCARAGGSMAAALLNDRRVRLTPCRIRHRFGKRDRGRCPSFRRPSYSRQKG